jgi:hypothetical protein
MDVTWSVIFFQRAGDEGVGSPLEMVLLVGSDRVPLKSGSAMW